MTEDARTASEPKSQLSRVAILDVLGAKVHSLPTAEAQLLAMTELVDKATQAPADLPPHLLASEGISASSLAATIHFFSDSLIAIWDSDQLDEPAKRNAPSALLMLIFNTALQVYRLPLRGAIGFGETIQNERSALGPGITDAAQWYDKADWIGIIVTPRYGMFLDAIAKEAGGEHHLAALFVRYDVPFKDNVRRNMWTIPWPWQWMYRAAHQNGPSARQAFTHTLLQMNMPMGTDHKYKHLQEFFEWYLDTWWPRVEEHFAAQ